MPKGGPSKETFEKLLRWLDPDRDRAGEKYENVRLRLIRIFTCRGCGDVEDLADETINVVASKVDWLIENYHGEPALFFYGVAKNIYHEQYKKKPPPPLPPPPDVTLAEQLSPEEAGAAISGATGLWQPVAASLQRISLVRFHPVELLWHRQLPG